MNGTANVAKNSMYYIFQFPGYYWYMSFFFGFYLLIPYFNAMIEHLEKRQFIFLIVALLAVTAVPEFWNSIPAMFKGEKQIFLPNWWKEFFPLTYYALGAYFRKFQPRLSKGILLAVSGHSCGHVIA
nr:hypothetical protein [Paenibacillus sp. MMS18-CY102]